MHWRVGRSTERETRLRVATQPVRPSSHATLLCAQVHQGLHWVCAMIDLQNKKLVYYDSLKVRLVAAAVCSHQRGCFGKCAESACAGWCTAACLGELRTTVVHLGAWCHLCASF